MPAGGRSSSGDAAARTQTGSDRILAGGASEPARGGGVRAGRATEAAVGLPARDRAAREEARLVQVQRKAARRRARETRGGSQDGARGGEASADHRVEIAAQESREADDARSGAGAEDAAGAVGAEPDRVRAAQNAA